MARKTKNLLRKKFIFQPRPKPPLGPYAKPVVTAIKLDPEQALITSCRIDGAWMNTNRTNCQMHFKFGEWCQSVRGGTGIGTDNEHLEVPS